MSTRSATATTGNLLSELLDRYTGPEFVQLVASLPDVGRSLEIRISPYNLVLVPANAWLTAVEQRIRSSVRPPEKEGEESTEWLSQSAADTAINFFRNAADLLPTEPHIYGTEGGDLVAEFETQASNVTSVVSPGETILFGVPKAAPGKPVEFVIRRGSDRLREEVKSFLQKLSSVSDGCKMVSSR